ncbi:uncharacterized protein EAE97_001452 [Botrytis byssoidea]|uniref:Uncharacterized protein n=1 Tax=Botrytis byssoidea TaxID=139641 RepID=A0A9P5M9N1_9HELO|nr:uncharacterized protein EAE97_001452 [Botrytis byssoidea]KAF7954054.1 hypothetical protein EAE97_001452 [Botrytis byssoidea]
MFRLLQEAKQIKNGESPTSSVEELSRFLVTFCVDFINSLRWDEDAPPSIRFWEEEAASKSIQLLYMEAIDNVAAQERKLFQLFKKKMEKKKKESDIKEPDSKIDKDIQEGENWSSISEATILLGEIKDILHELMILKPLLTQQQHVWLELVGLESGKDSSWGPTHILNKLTEMIEMAERNRKLVHDVLNLEQNSINIMEAVLSRKLAEESALLTTLNEKASREGKVLIVFTIVTVVFTPLSFLTSLFSLNITVFQHNSDGDIEYEPSWIFPIIFSFLPIRFLIIVR